MGEAYSRLEWVLRQKRITVPELQRRIRQHGMNVNLKSLYRLSNSHQPLERLDMRVAGAICEVCEVSLSDLVAFEKPSARLHRMSEAEQERLDTLMAQHNEGKLTDAEREELRALVQRAEELTLQNARLLQERQRQLSGE